MHKLPVVSIVCLSYNHEKFVLEALQSVFNQDYPNLEIILVDDASTDRTLYKIRNLLRKTKTRHTVKKIFLNKNSGNCTAFNRGLAVATGKYIIDFATDDVMLPDRISKQVACFENLTEEFGVIFTEAAYTDENGKHLYYHYQDRFYNNFSNQVPQGNIYKELVSTYFISSPTMMIRKSVLDRMHGYDENLAYEDFDFWVRSSRFCSYYFLNECTTKVRKSAQSLSKSLYKKGDFQLLSTYKICKKIFYMNLSPEEDQALVKRLKYEIRAAALTGNYREVYLFLDLLEKLDGLDNFYLLLSALLKENLPLFALRNFYLRYKYSF